MQIRNLIVVFLTGLLSGGISCLAVQAGLFATALLQPKSVGSKFRFVPIVAFLLGKLFVYTLLGALLGALGFSILLSPKWQMFLQLGVALFMLGTAGALLNIHPWFSVFIIKPPKFLAKFNQQNNLNSLFAPAILGVASVLVPCGATLAIMAQAITTNSIVFGALTMFFYILGTLPVFFLAGVLAEGFSFTLKNRLLKFSAWAIILLAIFNLNNVLALSGSTYTLGKISRSVFCGIAYCEEHELKSLTAVTNQKIEIYTSGYSPSYFTVPKNQEITLQLTNHDGSGCQQAFTIPSLNIQQIVPVGKVGELVFTTPNKKTQLVFSCSAGLYTGIINVN